jgi:hypothetical protein
MVQVFVFCERNFKGCIIEIKKTQTIKDLKEAIRTQQDEMAPEFKGASLLMGGQIDVLPDGTTRQTVDLGKTCDPCGRGFSRTNQAVGFEGRKFMASQFLPGPLNPGAHERPMTVLYKGHAQADDKTLAECNIGDGATVRLDI